MGPSSDAQPKPSTGAACSPVLLSDDLVTEDEMSLFGVVALVAALVHDLSMRQSATDPVFWPWAAIALSFYVGLDVALGAMAEAWERAKQGRLRG